MGTELANWVPAGVVVALIAGAFAVWQAKVGIRPAEREGFRADFQMFVKELKDENKELKAQNTALDTKVDELTDAVHALSGLTRQMANELRRNGLAVPVHTPPPNLDRYYNNVP